MGEALKAYQYGRGKSGEDRTVAAARALRREPMRTPGTATSKLRQANGKLTIDFKSTPRMGGTLEHWQYDSFITRFDDKTIEPAYVTFGLNADGKVERVTMKAVSPLADFSYDYQDLLFTPIEASK